MAWPYDIYPITVVISKDDALRIVAGDRELAARLRLRQALMRGLDQVAASGRLAHLRDATGATNPDYWVKDFRVRWWNMRMNDKLVNLRTRRDMREARRAAGWKGPPEYLIPPWDGGDAAKESTSND